MPRRNGCVRRLNTQRINSSLTRLLPALRGLSMSGCIIGRGGAGKVRRCTRLETQRYPMRGFFTPKKDSNGLRGLVCTPTAHGNAGTSLVAAWRDRRLQGYWWPCWVLCHAKKYLFFLTFRAASLYRRSWAEGLRTLKPPGFSCSKRLQGGIHAVCGLRLLAIFDEWPPVLAPAAKC